MLRQLTPILGAMLPLLIAAVALPPTGRAEDRLSAQTPIYWRQTRFLVPFEIQSRQDGGEVAKVELHVSDDRGKTWKLAGTTTPTESKFLYSAPRDGEYWFDVTTIDRQGKVRGDTAHAPGLKVVVDTAPPRLEFDAWRGSAGELVGRWKADDPHLDRNSLVVEYQLDGDGPWQQLAVSGVGDGEPSSYASESTWWIGAGEGPLTLRAKILDRAGNSVATQAVARAAAPESAAPRLRQDVAKPAPRTVVTASETARRPTDSTNSSGPSLPRQWPADNSLNVYPTRNRRAAGSAADADSNRPGSSPAWHHREQDREAGLSQDAARGDAGLGSASDVAGGLGPRAAGSRMPATTVSSRGEGSRRRGPSPLDFGLVPAGERPRMVNSRSFELEYEVESVGASGIAKVELWGTRDGGLTWSQLALDEDNRSPLDVTLDQEGIYGFAIVVESGSGVGTPPPKSGDLPEVWVGVDLTPPAAVITNTEMSDEGGEITIHWQAEDDLLEPRPIALLYGEHPNGPWKPIAAGLENTGSYRWRLDNRLPDQIYVRLEVTDEAQNVTANVTPQPVSLDRQRPSARFRAVRPIGR